MAQNGIGFNPKKHLTNTDELRGRYVKLVILGDSYFGQFAGNTKDGFYILDNPVVFKTTKRGEEAVRSNKQTLVPMQQVSGIQEVTERDITLLIKQYNHYVNAYHGRYVGMSTSLGDIYGRVCKVHRDCVVLDPATGVICTENGGLETKLSDGATTIKRDQIFKTRLILESDIEKIVIHYNKQKEEPKLQ